MEARKECANRIKHIPFTCLTGNKRAWHSSSNRVVWGLWKWSVFKGWRSLTHNPFWSTLSQACCFTMHFVWTGDLIPLPTPNPPPLSATLAPIRQWGGAELSVGKIHFTFRHVVTIFHSRCLAFHFQVLYLNKSCWWWVTNTCAC